MGPLNGGANNMGKTPHWLGVTGRSSFLWWCSLNIFPDPASTASRMSLGRLISVRRRGGRRRGGGVVERRVEFPSELNFGAGQSLPSIVVSSQSLIQNWYCL